MLVSNTIVNVAAGMCTTRWEKAPDVQPRALKEVVRVADLGITASINCGRPKILLGEKSGAARDN